MSNVFYCGRRLPAGEWLTFACLAILPAFAATVDEKTEAVVPEARGVRAVAPDDAWDWIDGRDLPIEGRAFTNGVTYYSRLPASAMGKVEDGIWATCQCSAGLQFRFVTDSSRIRLKWSLNSPSLSGWNLPTCGKSGIDVYAWRTQRPDGTKTDGEWWFVDAGAVRAQNDNVLELKWRGEPCLVNLPLYNGVTDFKLGVEKGAKVRPLAVPHRSGVMKPVVFYGGSIVQGASAGRPGMSWVNIVGRALDVPVVNLGFNGQGKIEVVFVDYLASVDASCYVFMNFGNMGLKLCEERYEKFLRALHARRPTVPLVIGQHCYYLHGRGALHAFAPKLIERLRRDDPEFAKWLYLVRVDDMFAPDSEGTSDGGHPNDWGSMHMAKAFAKVIGEALKGTVGISAPPDGIEIVAADDAPKTVRFAAEELRGLLKRALGRDIPVANRPSARLSIVLGDNVWSRAAGIDVAKLPRDGFRIVTDAASRRVYIAGRDDPAADLAAMLKAGGSQNVNSEHATLFGVYDFLERFAGVRFYFPTELGTCVPPLERLTVPATDLTSVPAWIARHYYRNGDGDWPEALDADFGGRMSGKLLSWMRLRMQTKRICACHGQNALHYTERFRDTHPEYLQLRKDGRRAVESEPNGASDGWRYGHWCHTSPVWDVLYEDVLAKMRAGEDYVDISPQDGFQRCWCEKCRAAYNDTFPGSYATELLWGNTARLAERLLDAKARGRVLFPAYQPYNRVPDFTIPSNVVVEVCENGPWMLTQPEMDARQERRMRAWHAKTGAKNLFWFWATKYSGFKIADVPQNTPRACAAFYNRIAPIMLGGFHESSSDRALYNYLNYYVYSRVAWDGKVDVEAILEEHDRLMFGAAAPQMREFYAALEERWMKGVAGRPGCVGTNALGPTILAPSPLELWMQIYTPERIAHWGRLFDEALAAVPAGSLEAKRLKLIRSVFLVPMEKKSAEYVEMASAPFQPTNLPDGWKLSDPDGVAAVDAAQGISKTGAFRLSSDDQCPTGAYVRACATIRLEGDRRLKPRKTYRLSYSVKLDGVRPYVHWSGLDVEVIYDGNGLSCLDYPLAGTSDWVRQTKTFTVPEKLDDKVGHLLRFRLIAASGTVWIDGIRLEEVR